MFLPLGKKLKLFQGMSLIAHTECLEEVSKNARKSEQAVTSKPVILLSCGQSNILLDIVSNIWSRKGLNLKVLVLKSLKKVLKFLSQNYANNRLVLYQLLL